MVHAVKCFPKFFLPLSVGVKTFEVRKKDRLYREGDYLAINEFVPDSDDPYDNFPQSTVSIDERRVDGGRYTGKSLLFRITYILDDKDYCKEGMVILGLDYVLGR